MHTYICFTGRFVLVRGGFCPVFFVWKVLFGVVFVRPSTVRIIHNNKKLNITFHFRFHMYEIFFKEGRHMLLDPVSPLLQTVTPSRNISPSSVAYFVDVPKVE